MKSIIYNGKVWTGAGNQNLEEIDILVEDGKICKLIKHVDNSIQSKEMAHIDANGKTIIPGLINSHTHISMDGSESDPVAAAYRDGQLIMMIKSIKCAKEYIQSGVTTVWDCGAMYGIDFALKKAIHDGLIFGPRIQASGKAICMTGGHARFVGMEIDGVDAARHAARLMLKDGADVVKVIATGGVMTPGVEPGMSQLTIEEMRAACEEAHKAGRRVQAHAQGAEGIKNAIKAGVDVIAHAHFLDDEGIEMMLAHGTYLVPTLVSTYRIVERSTNAGIPEYAVLKAKSVMKAQFENFRKAHKAGVKLAMGTDQGTPFNQPSGTFQEMQLMVENGLTTTEALTSATRIAAESLNLSDKIGSIEPGKLADIVAIEGNPLVDIKALENVSWTMKEGEIVYSR